MKKNTKTELTKKELFEKRLSSFKLSNPLTIQPLSLKTSVKNPVKILPTTKQGRFARIEDIDINPIINSLLYQVAKKLAFTAVNTIYNVCPTDEITTLKNQFYSINSLINQTNKTLTNAMDAISVAQKALYTIYKIYNDKINVISLDEFLASQLDFTFTYKKKTITTKIFVYKAVNKYIYSKKSTKGRKTIANKTVNNNGDISTYDMDMNLIDTEPGSEYTTYSNGYAVELTSLNVMLDSPQDFESLSYDAMLTSELEYNDILNLILELLTPLEQKIFNFLQKGYSQKQISTLTKININTVYSHILRIRKKIANSKYFDNNKTVSAYKTIK